MWETLAANLGSTALGGMTAPPPAAISSADGLSVSDRSVVNVAPVGFNLGEIIRAFEGPPENGGFGIDKGSRLGTNNQEFAAARLTSQGGSFRFSTAGLLAGGIALVAGAWILKRAF